MQLIRRASYTPAISYGVLIGAMLGLTATAGWLHTAAAQANGATAASTAEDPWRRTPNGWELVDRWDRAKSRENKVGLSLRVDSHPAVLALAQSLAIVAAFALFPPRQLSA